MKTLLLHTEANMACMNVLVLVFFIISSLTVSSSTWAVQDIHDWQVHRLLHPTDAQLKKERQGHVFIYDGLSDKDVQRAMDQGFDRINSMMFINVKKTKADSGTETEGGSDDSDDSGCE